MQWKQALSEVGRFAIESFVFFAKLPIAVAKSAMLLALGYF